jgi:hypothetical protein
MTNIKSSIFTNDVSTITTGDGTNCRQLSPAPGPVLQNAQNSAATKQGLPHGTSKMVVAQKLLYPFHQKALKDLPRIESLQQYARLSDEWSRVKKEVETLLGRTLKGKKEPPANQDVINVIKDLVPTTIFQDLLVDIVESVLREESINNIDRIVNKSIVSEVWEFLYEQMLDELKVKFFVMMGLAKNNKAEQQRRSKIRKMDTQRLIEEATKKSTKLSRVLTKISNKLGLKLSDHKMRNISKKVLKKLADPTLLLPGLLGKIAKKLSGTPLLVIRLIFTPTNIASNSDDVLPHIADQIEDAFVEASMRLVPSPNLGSAIDSLKTVHQSGASISSK